MSIFISNLPWTVDNGALSDHIGSVSPGVVRADVLMNRGPNGPRSRGMAIVDFESPEAARAAVEVRARRGWLDVASCRTWGGAAAGNAARAVPLRGPVPATR